MSATRQPRMTVDDFISWAVTQPEGGRYELEDGEVVVDMAPERAVHVATKFEIAFRLRLAIEAAGSTCKVMPDGAGVRVGAAKFYQPDALVRCGHAMPADALFVTDPLILVEVSSPSTSARDMGLKFDGYFSLPSVRHYIFVEPLKRLVIHHERRDDGLIVSHAIHDSVVRLDPPGVTLDNFWPEGLTE